MKVEAEGIQSQEFLIAERELSVKWVKLLEEFCQLSKKERRKTHRNLFENFWMAYKQRRNTGL